MLFICFSYGFYCVLSPWENIIIDKQLYTFAVWAENDETYSETY